MFAGLGIFITYTVAPIVLRASIENKELAEQAISFLYIRIWGLPLLYLYIMRNALLVGTNQTRFLVWGALSETLVNIFLDYGLIYGHFGLPHLGFNGAAYASIIAEGAGLIVIYFVIQWMGINKSLALFEDVTFDFSIAKLILVQSSPLILQYAISIIT